MIHHAARGGRDTVEGTATRSIINDTYTDEGAEYKHLQSRGSYMEARAKQQNKTINIIKFTSFAFVVSAIHELTDGDTVARREDASEAASRRRLSWISVLEEHVGCKWTWWDRGKHHHQSQTTKVEISLFFSTKPPPQPTLEQSLPNDSPTT